jgi:pantoate--beta-alanine ligase
VTGIDLAQSREELAAGLAALPAGTSRATVLTMGGLHRGHAELLRTARDRVGPTGHVTVTIFVNPLQFGSAEDLASYPRDLRADVQLCARAGADLVFAPPEGEVYPAGPPQVVVDPGPLGTLLEGAVRPGHFRSVLTVVHKLLSLTAPSLTVFGEKDYQQLVLVRRMVQDLDLPVDVVGAATARDTDGLALSSRNARLSAMDRTSATAVPVAIESGRAVASQGVPAVLAAVHDVLDREALTLDYAAVTDPDLGPAPERGPARLLVAAQVGSVRLLDNAALQLGSAS